MVLPPSIAMPETLRGVDDLIKAEFEAFRALWFSRLLLATFLVVVGLFMEGPELLYETHSIIHRWRFNSLFRFSLPEMHIPDWAKLIAFIGWVLIVVGVAGEFVVDSFVSKADGFVQRFDEVLLADAQQKSGLANQRAAMAFERAARTEKEAAEDLKSTSIARQNAEAARERAEGFELQIAEANKTAAEVKLELAKFKAPRGFNSEQQIQSVVDKCKVFPKTPFIPLCSSSQFYRILKISNFAASLQARLL